MKRPEYMIEALRQEFDLYGTVEEVSLQTNDNEAGKIYINTTEADILDKPWTGKYFTDYPIQVSAVANPGYRFVGWQGTYEVTENVIEVPVIEGGVQLTAIFEKVN